MKRYRLTKKDFLETSIFATAFVTKPAIEVGLIYLDENKQPANKVMLEKGIAYSPVLIPNQVIPRVSDEGEEFEVYFEAEDIEELSQDYMKAGSPMGNWNSQHDDNQKLEGVHVVENWIIEDAENDKATRLGFKLPKGTWMQGIKVESEAVKDKIKSGEYFGISIEGDFDHVIKLKSINIIKEMDSIKKTITELAKAVGIKGKQKFGMQALDSGAMIYFDGEELGEGSIVYADAEGTVLAPAGEHTLEDGRVIVLGEDSAVMEVKAVAVEVEAELTEAEFKTEDVENIAKVTVTNSESIESLRAENVELREFIKGFETKLSEVVNSVNEHSTKLSKVEAPESVTKLESTVELKLNDFQALRNRAIKRVNNN